MDLGHPVKFGFATEVRHIVETVELVQTAEELGLDTVSILETSDPDASVDPWTTATWLAGKTAVLTINAPGLDPRVHVPGMTARAVASLDILTGGRAELTLNTEGTREFVNPKFDAVALQSPQEELDFLTESVAVIRTLWDTANTGNINFSGDFHQLLGAQSGPAPAHNIRLWLNSENPVVVGELADGWVTTPTLQMAASENNGGQDQLSPEALHGLAAQQRAIDTAAIAVGRDPREIVRKVQLDRSILLGADPAGEMIKLVNLGFSEFELLTNRPLDLTIWAMEIAPVVQNKVAAVRAEEGITTAVVKHLSVRSRRSSAINYDAIPLELRNRMVEPGEARYGAVKSTYMRGGTPSLVLQPQTPQEVSAAVLFAQEQGVEVGTRSGGHGFSGRSTNRGGIVIDVGGLNQIQVLDKANRIVRVGPGARWGQVAAAIEPHGWVISSGDSGGVGVGGLATAGGVGFFGRKHGLTIDHMVAAEIVLADGSHVRASETENSDLFWAIRGAGQNFGIVTAFEFQAAEVGDIGYAQLALQVGNLPEFLVAYGALVEAAPRELTPFLLMGKQEPTKPIIAQIMAVVASDNADEIIAALQPFASLGELVGQQVYITSYAQLVDSPEPGVSRAMGEPVGRGAAINHITPAFAKELAGFILSGETYFFQIRATGGATAEVPVHATAYAHRAANFHLSALAANQNRLNTAWDAMSHHFDGLYLSFDTDRRPERVKDAFPPITLARLEVLKKQYDPNNVFRDNFNILVAPETV